MIDNPLYSKITPQLKKFITQAYLENGTFDQIVKHLESEIELNGPVADEHLIKTEMTVTQKEKKPRKIQQKTECQH